MLGESVNSLPGMTDPTATQFMEMNGSHSMIKPTNDELLAVLRKTALILSGDESRWDELPELAQYYRNMLTNIATCAVEGESYRYFTVQIDTETWKDLQRMASWRGNYVLRR